MTIPTFTLLETLQIEYYKTIGKRTIVVTDNPNICFSYGNDSPDVIHVGQNIVTKEDFDIEDHTKFESYFGMLRWYSIMYKILKISEENP